MRRLLASTFVAAGAAALLATGAAAQMNSGTGVRTGTMASPFETVVRIDQTANRVVVQNAAGQRRIILMDSSTGIERQGRPGTTATPMRIAELAPGDRIVVSGATRQGGFTAQRIEVLSSAGVVVPGANPASPPGTVRPGAPGATPGMPTGPPSGSTGGSPSGSTGGAPSGSTGGTGGGMGGGGTGGAGGGAGGGGGR